ncbi:MAG: phasin-related domain-containing protein [Leptonema sp. (in: bacteria)]
MENLQKTLNDLLNVGIGFFKASEENVKKAMSEFEKIYEDLKQKGATENSELVSNLRKNLDDIVKQLNELNSKANQTFSDVSKQINQNYQKLAQEIEKIVPKEQLEQFKAKLEELNSTIQNKIDEFSKQFKKEDKES